MTKDEPIGFSLEKESIYLESNMSKEEVLRLGKLVSEGDKAAEEALVLGHIRLMKRIIYQYKDKGLSYEDLFQEGSLALIQAVKNFDYTKNIMFSTFATRYIIRNIQRALTKAEMIEKPERKVIELNRYRYIRSTLHVELGRPPEDEEIAEKMGVSIESVKKLNGMIYEYLSIDQTSNIDRDSGERPGVLISRRVSEPKDTSEPVDEQVFRQMGLLDFFDMEDLLSEKEQRILSLRFNQKGREMTFKEISEILGGTPEGIRTAYNKAINKLQKGMKNKNLTKKL